MNYVFYPDVFWITNFILDCLTLFLVRKFSGSHSGLWRIFPAAAVGVTGSLLLLLRVPSWTGYQLIVHLVLNPLMLLMAFSVGSLRQFAGTLAADYLLTALFGGLMNWELANMRLWPYFWLMAIGGFGICMLAMHWMGRRRRQVQEYEILLLTGRRKLALRGFLDTGNLLKDPILNRPVHIIQEEALQEELAEEALPIRYIPYHSLGQEQGLLAVVTLNAMYLKPVGDAKQQKPWRLEHPVFGLARENLFRKKRYQVILNAETGGLSCT